jgi:hypothetical protein
VSERLRFHGRPAICSIMVTSSMRRKINETAAADIVRQTRATASHNVDTERLAEDLNCTFWCFERERTDDLVASQQARKSIEKFASRMRKLERDLTESRLAPVLQTGLMRGACQVGATDEVYQALGLPEDPDKPWDPRVKLAVPRLLTAVGLMAHWARAAMDAPVAMSRMSAIEMLIGISLPHFYKMHFGKPFGAGTAGDRRADGPGIRFVRACLAAAAITRPDGKPYSEETIRTYWANAQTLRFRRGADKSRKKS